MQLGLSLSAPSQPSPDAQFEQLAVIAALEKELEAARAALGAAQEREARAAQAQVALVDSAEIAAAGRHRGPAAGAGGHGRSAERDRRPRPRTPSATRRSLGQEAEERTAARG